MTKDPRLVDTDPDLDWSPPKSPAEIEAEDNATRARVRNFADRWGSAWIVIPAAVTVVASVAWLLKQCG